MPNLFLPYEYLDQRRLGEQMVDCVAIYAVAAQRLGLPAPYNRHGKPYRLENEAHPVVLWASQSIENALFCVDLCLDCNDMWQDRGCSVHGCARTMFDVLQRMPEDFDYNAVPCEHIFYLLGQETWYGSYDDVYEAQLGLVFDLAGKGA